MKLSAHFDSKEFRCRGPECHGVEPLVAPELVENLEKLRGLLNATRTTGEPEHTITINSGARCEVHNRREGGKATSQHLCNRETGQECRAADIYSPTRSTRQVYEAALQVVGFRGIGLAPPVAADPEQDIKARRGYVHVDVRATPTRARWGYGRDGSTTTLANVLPWLPVDTGRV